MANECIPLFRPGDDITCQVSAAVLGKRFVSLSATRDVTTGLMVVAQSGAAARHFGVAAYDQPTVGSRVPVIRGKGSIIPVTSGAAIAFNAELEVDASGRAVTFSAGAKVGRAVEAVGAANTDVMIELY